MDKAKLIIAARMELRNAQEGLREALKDPNGNDSSIEQAEIRLLLAALALVAVLK